VLCCPRNIFTLRFGCPTRIPVQTFVPGPLHIKLDMVEILAPIGMCLASMAFVLGTVPASAKFFHSYKEQREMIEDFESRLSVCQVTYSTWRMPWNASKMVGLQHHLQSCLAKMNQLDKDMKIIRNHLNPTERRAFDTMRQKMRRGVFSIPKANVLNFCNGVRFALWKKDILEGWMKRLEDTFKVINELFDQDYHTRTDNHHNDKFNRTEKLQMLEEFIDKLTSMAKCLYNECLFTPDTSAWALGLQAPAEGAISISRWDKVAPLDIELCFLMSQKQDGDKHFRLRVCYQQDDDRTHTTEAVMEALARARAVGEDGKIDRCKHVKCEYEKLSSRRTLPMGRLLESKPHLFEDAAWLVDRGELIYGLAEWALLLWETPFFDKLCCDGLIMEADHCSSVTAASRQTFGIFDVTAHHRRCDDRQHRSRLKNLGIVWAQLITGVPIRSVTGNADHPYEQLTENGWEPMRLSNINGAIHKATGSAELQAAIDFCLLPEDAGDEFTAGHLFKYIDRIYTPSVLY
jgi:hypothetical protein